jgi:hypothetical protein
MRRGLVALAVAALAVTAGCAGGVDEQRLAENATYQWDTDARATVNITGSQYQAVYRVENNSTLEVYRRDDIGGERPVPIEALRFRYPNGTVVGPGPVTATQEGSRVVVDPPADGRVAYTGPTRPKSFSSPALVEGSHEVILPPNMRIAVPVLGSAGPSGYNHSIEADRVHLHWESLDRGTGMTLRYYLQRDLLIFAGLIGLLAVAGVVGLLYFRRQLRELAERREATDIED